MTSYNHVSANRHVAVLIPVCHEAPDIIERALNSAVSQIDVNVSIYVLASGSKTQNAAQFCQAYAKNHRNVHFQQTSKSLDAAQARNTLLNAIPKQQQKCIAFLDADDEWRPNHLKQFFELVPSSLEEFVIYTSAYIQRQSARVISPQGTRTNIWSIMRQPLLISSTIIVNLPDTLRFKSGVAEDLVFFADALSLTGHFIGGQSPSVLYNQTNWAKKNLKFKLRRTFKSFYDISGNRIKALFFLALFSFHYLRRTYLHKSVS